MKLTRELLLTLGLVAALLALTVTAGVMEMLREARPPYSSRSTEPAGAQALVVWLAALGYQVDKDPRPGLAAPAEAGVIVLLEPSEAVDPAALRALARWVRAGGALLAAGNDFYIEPVYREFGVSLASAPASAGPRAAVPLLASPPFTGTATAEAEYYLEAEAAEAIPLAALAGRPVALWLEHGEGRVIFISTPTIFSNAGLREPGNGALVLNLFTAAQPDGAARLIWVDEWHHGERPLIGAAGEIIGPEAWLQRTPAGHALVFSAALIFIALALRGRAFGRPLPSAREITRRAPLEYITALANLSRRAGHREAVLGQYAQRLKRQLGRRYRLDPTLRDPEYVAQLAAYRPELDREALTQLLNRLRRSTVSEAELVALAGEVARWTED